MRQIAGLFPATEYPDVLVGLGEPDDAAIYRIDETRALIQTTDFFTPVVDDPFTYGAIAAANSLSDVYAMGGEALVCLNIAGFPEELHTETIGEIFAGGATKVREAGAVITGGHTVTNPEPFYGLSVTGMVEPKRIMRKGGARPGDRLFLSKPLGTGVVTTAAKLTGPGESRGHWLARKAQGKPDCDPAHLQAAMTSMMTLNRSASQAAQAASVCSGTDITGFGLLGHASEMAAACRREAQCGFRIHAASVPVLPGVDTYIAAGYLTRGSTRNPEYFGSAVRFAASVGEGQRTLLWEAETSGGLFLAVPATTAEIFRQECAARGQTIWEIGEVVDGIEGIEVV